jgi:Domain of unknown function (DUF3806)
MGQRMSDPSESERAWIAANIELAAEIAKATGLPVDPGDHLAPSTLDAAWAAWLAGHDRATEDPNPYINAFGLAFGQHLVDDLGLAWKVVEDRDGTEMAVWGEVGDVLVFPPNLVGKRYVEGATGFFVPTADQIARRVQDLRGHQSERQSGLGRLFRRRD